MPAALLLAAALAVSGAQSIGPPKQLKRVEPIYPDAARQARIQGVVTIEATIGTDGKVKDAKVVGSIPQLDEAALAAVRQWEYAPTIVGGVAKPVIMTVRVNFSLSGPGTASAPVPAPPLPAQAQREWEQLVKRSAALMLEDKTSEAIPLVQRFAARYPAHADSQYELGRMYEYRTFSATDAAAKRRDMETAVKHYTRAAELQSDPAFRFVMIWKVEQLYEPDNLNDPAEAERYARRLVAEFPSRAESHVALAKLLHDKGDLAGASDALRNGRAASKLPVPGLLLTVQYAVEQVQARRDLPRAEARALLDEAILAADAVIAHPEKDERDYRLATMAKSLALEYQAERVAQTREQRLAFLIEADRLDRPIEEHKNGAPPPARTLSAAETNEIEWRAIQRWNGRLADEGKIDEAISSYRQYLRQRPGFHEAYAQIADLSMRAAKETTNESARTASLEQAAAALQQVVDLAPAVSDRDYAFSRLIDLYGPAQLNRPAQQEASARAMIKRQPSEPAAHAALAAVLLRTGKAAAADTALRGARTAVKPTAPARAGLAGALVRAILAQPDLPPAASRRLFDEADVLLKEAAKLNANDLAVIEGRMSWLNLSAERFERDPARAAAQREEAKQLMARALALRQR